MTFCWRLVRNFCKFRVPVVQNRFCYITTMAYQYPSARREDVKDTYHNVEVADPYRWLEDPDAEDTKQYVEEQNAVTHPYIEECSFKEEINKSVTKLWNYPKYSTPFKQGSKYYQYRNTGLQNQSVIYQLDSLDSEATVFLDPNLLSKDGTIALSTSKFSEDGKVFAYGLSSSGSDWIEIKFRNVETGKDYNEILTKVKFSPMTWMHDNKGFFYGAYLHKQGKADGSETDCNEYQKLYYHCLGTDQSQDFVVVEFDDPQLRIGATVSYCGKYLVVTAVKGCKNNLLYFARMDGEVTGKLNLKPVVTELEADYEYITNNGSKFFFRTNKDAPNYRIIVIDFDNPDKANWSTLVPEHEKDVLDWGKAINTNQLVLCYLRDVKNTLSLHKLESGEKIMDFPIELGTINGISGKREHTEMFYRFVSFLTPNIIYKVDFSGSTIKQTVFHETKVGDLDPSKYVSKQEFYTSKDGTKVPMFIVHKKGFVMDGTKPCMLYGYGGFNINVTPSFSVSRLVFVNHFDGCFVVANIRGGGEYGDKWHNGGRFANKQNCFDDFQYAAKYLVENKYTNSDKLTILGGSNGGLLVAACINQAPQLFATAICQVGVLDMLRFHKFTIGYAWKSDYGSSETSEGFDYLYKYSPLHNIKIPEGDVQYPATLLLTADHDDRVVPLHSLKFIAELQHKIGNVPKQTNPLMVRVETRAGHGAGKPTAKLIEEVTDTLCFIAKSTNLEFHE
ncbi:PREDICTED: prolyl endopeptidase isoform X2 [Nicrophorus vespilloides]|uniref:Prolyl endopeptidase n=1 Tax=Nicrophorus vespilloides TaxID=110193 RepID=A0ABM1M5Z8_NICVS|nr:PREDICTED: prolyl endopeptidase isoform X2 [Nicrophorus vespilloides]